MREGCLRGRRVSEEYHMVESENRHIAELQSASNCVTNDGGPKMSYMHLFGNIWGREVNNCPLIG